MEWAKLNYLFVFCCSRWDFHSEEGDITFAIYRKKEGEMIPVIFYDRVDCDMSTEEGEIRCDENGVCKLMPSFIAIFFLFDDFSCQRCGGVWQQL